MARLERLRVETRDAGQRLDRYLAAHLPALSRTRLAELIAEGRVRVNGGAAKRSHRLTGGQTVEVEVQPRPPLEAAPEDLPLEVLYEDDEVVVLNKPAGMTVHAGAGHASGTVVNALLHRYRALSSLAGALRPGIVHRLDKDTSGALLVARTDAAHADLARQFAARQIKKTYLALVHGRLAQDSGTIGLPIARDLHRRTRMTTRRREGRAARTDWRVLARLDGYTLVEVDLHTGRTHQIRVHFSALGHPVVGDTLYGAPREPRAGRRVLAPLGRNFLHAARIGFTHPATRDAVDVRAPLPAALREWLAGLASALGAESGEIEAALRPYTGIGL
jgi:23S rRNA pseudouridine1911/1915/1917 synthase